MAFLVPPGRDLREQPCPNVFDLVVDETVGTAADGSTGEPTEVMAAVQGRIVTDQAVLDQLDQMPEDETIVMVPRALLLEYARKVLQEEGA